MTLLRSWLSRPRKTVLAVTAAEALAQLFHGVDIVESPQYGAAVVGGHQARGEIVVAVDQRFAHDVVDLAVGQPLGDIRICLDAVESLPSTSASIFLRAMLA